MKILSWLLCLCLISAPVFAQTAGETLDKGIEKTKETYHTAKDKAKKGIKTIKGKLKTKHKKKKSS